VDGTLFSATDQPLINYIRFAFGRSQGEMLRAPSWVYEERFDIQGRAAGKPTKTDMRLMIRAVLTERFKLAWHLDQREASVFQLLLAKPGELGPQLKRHQGDLRCEQQPKTQSNTDLDAIPCGSAGLVTASSPGRGRITGRAEPLARLAALLSNNAFAGVDRMVLDGTGLVGVFDFTVEWALPTDPREVPSPQTLDDQGQPLDVALRQHLGLTLRTTRALVDVPAIDSVERPRDD